MAKKKPSLGRGLGALLESAQVSAEIKMLEASETEQDIKTVSGTVSPESLAVSSESLNGALKDGALKELPIEFIQRGQYQPRKDMSEKALEELAQSIKQYGIMQPVIVRPLLGKKYELIAGERRWKACQLAGLSTIPVVIKEVSDAVTMAMALIENIQREDLNPMEEAIALDRLKSEFELTQQEVADAVGKSRVTITNLLRLINLQSEVKLMLEHGDIEMGHARALLGLTETQQVDAANTVVTKALSVRQTEALVRHIQKQKTSDKSKLPNKTDPNVRKLEEDLSAKIGARVDIKHSAEGKGKLVINYQTLDELDGILLHIH